MDGAQAWQANSLGGILGCKMAFYALFPRRKADGCGGKDSGDYLEEYLSNSATSLSLKPIFKGTPWPTLFERGMW